MLKGAMVGWADSRVEEGVMEMLLACKMGARGQVAMWPSVLAVQSWMLGPKRMWAAFVRQAVV